MIIIHVYKYISLSICIYVCLCIYSYTYIKHTHIHTCNHTAYRAWKVLLYFTATLCNTLQHTATQRRSRPTKCHRYCWNALQHSRTHFTTLCRPGTAHEQAKGAMLDGRMHVAATRCNTLQHTATHRNTLQHTATHENILEPTATHCNTLYRHGAAHEAPKVICWIVGCTSSCLRLGNWPCDDRTLSLLMWLS